MNIKEGSLKFNREKINDILFWILLIILIFWVFPFINKGIDIEDTGFYMTKYKYIFDPEINVRSGSILFTEILGGIFYSLCGSYHILILNIISWGCYLISGVSIYSFFKRKKKDVGVLFLIITGMMFSCTWIRAFNYNTLSMLFLVAETLLLLKAIKEDNSFLLAISGALVGVNIFVRVPNVLQCILILSLVWYYGMRKKERRKAFRKSLVFAIGMAVGAMLSALLSVMFLGGSGFWNSILEIVGDASNTNSRHGIWNIIKRAYEGLEYGVELWSTKLLVILLIMFVLYVYEKKCKNLCLKEKIFNTATFLIILVGIVWGICLDNMYAVGDMTAVFLIVSGFLFVLLPKMDDFCSTVALVVLVSELTLTIGTDNGWYYQCVFMMLPLVVIFLLWKRVGKEYRIEKYVKIIIYFMISVITSYGIKYATTFVYRDDNHAALRYNVEIPECRGMKTEKGKGEALEELKKQLDICEERGEKTLAVLGDCSIAWSITNLKPCFSNAWPDLESFSEEKFEDEIKKKIQNNDFPVIVISDFDLNNEIDAVAKYEILKDIIQKYNYELQFGNNYFQIFIHDSEVQDIK